VTGRLVAGLDLGSTGVKILVANEDGTELLVRQRPTPWRGGAGGTTDIDADDLIATLRQLLQSAADDLGALVPARDAVIGAIAISGMGETGILVDRDAVPAAHGFAWFDPRGQQEIDAIPPCLRSQFAGRTGLPAGAQVSVAKLLHLRRNGLGLDGLRWFNLPEYIAAQLGSREVSEYSLASRTGLLDQDTGQPWGEMLDYLGVGDDFLPPLVDAGTDLGAASASWLPPAFVGARVTVAGHDHLVSAVSGGTIPGDRNHVSMGTAEVLLRVLDEPIPPQAREQLAGYLINSVRHVVPGKHVVVAGVKTGLLMRRALQLSGISDRTGRDELDRMAQALPLEGSLAADAIEVRGARNDDGVLSLTVRADGVSPAELFNAVLRHGNAELRLLLDAMDDVIPAASSTLLTGGWARMGSVQRARSVVLPQVTVSNRDQDTGYGAALFAARLLPPQSGAKGGAVSVRGSATTNDPPEPSFIRRHRDDGVETPRAMPLENRNRSTPMNELTTLERRAMAAISTPSGRMLIVAADQRNGMKAVMTDAPDGPGSVTLEQLADAKSDLVRYLGNHAPAILLDPEVSLPRVVEDSTLARDTALVVGMDASGFETVDGLRYTRYVDGVTARGVRELGGDVAKMLFYMRPDQQTADSRVGQEIRDLVKACEAEGLLLIVEVLTYRLENETEEDYREAFPQLVADAARIAVECGAKVLKLPYPGSAEASAAVTAAASGVPWAVLSAGVDHETFIKQVEIAVANGASGAMAGRSLWKDSLAVSSETREHLLTSRALPRLRELATVVDGGTARA
jgi:tagatose-1,6-bisphosphate aldolase/sugar (pentulose or hexulose) kinase